MVCCTSLDSLAIVSENPEDRDDMPPGHEYVTTKEGIRLFIQTLGSGPQTLVIPNGFYLVDDFKHLATGRTLFFLDLRNRGRSDQVSDSAQVERGIHNDVDDLDAVRRHFEISQMDLLGHSYMGLLAILYAMKYPAHLNRVVQIGPMDPFHGKQYPAHLTCADDTLREVFTRLAEMQKERGSSTPEGFCRKFWAVLRQIYVADPADADKLNWGRCELPNELNFMKYWTENILPSIQNLKLTPEAVAQVKTQVLTIHGKKDRSAPYGGGREWALLLPNARLVTVQNGGHAPWIEAPELVFGAIKTFLDGAWPTTSERVESLDSDDGPAKSTAV
jgi:proline iminopeptidase